MSGGTLGSLAVSTGSCSGPVGKDFAGAPSALLVWCGGADGERPGPLSVPGAASAFQGRQPRATPGSCPPTKWPSRIPVRSLPRGAYSNLMPRTWQSASSRLRSALTPSHYSWCRHLGCMKLLQTGLPWRQRDQRRGNRPGRIRHHRLRAHRCRTGAIISMRSRPSRCNCRTSAVMRRQ